MMTKKLSLRSAWLGAMAALIVFAGACSNGDNGNSPADPPPIDTQTQAAGESPSPTSSASESTSPETSPSSSPTPDLDPVSAIMANMTLEEKVGQMIMIGIDGTTLDETASSLIEDRHIGGVIFYKENIGGLSASVKLVNSLKAANADNDAPLLLGVDQEGGKVSRLPEDFEKIPDNATVGKSGDADLAEEMGGLLAAEVRTMGFNVNFAPVLDVNSNPNNPVIGVRSFGADAELVAKMGVAEMRGMQDGGVITAVKHFPGHGDTSVDSHLTLPVVRKTLDQLRQLEWVPFKAAIDEGADMVMVAHILFPRIDNDAPASFSKVIIGDQLRGTLGFDGVVITDEMTMGAIANNFGIVNAALKSVEAGSDILMIAHGYDKMRSVYDQLHKAVKEGRIPESRIDDSVRRVLTLKLKYELSDAATPIPSSADLPNERIREWKAKLEAAK